MRRRPHQCHADVGFRASTEPTGVRADLQICRDKDHFEHRAPGGGFPIGRYQPLRMIPTPLPYRQIGHHRDIEFPQGGRRPDPGEHQQMRRLDRAGGEHHPVGIQCDQTLRPDGLDSRHPGAGRPDPGDSGAGQHRQVRPVQRGLQKGRARTSSLPTDDVQWHRAHPGRGVVADRCGIEVRQPPELRRTGSGGECRCRPAHRADPPDGDRPAATQLGVVEVCLDRSVVRFDIRPRPPGDRGVIEVGGQCPAEVAAVDRSRPAKAGAPHDVDLPVWVVGERGAVPDDYRTAGGDRQHRCIVDQRPDDRVGAART